jgi:hypothetical protein
LVSPVIPHEVVVVVQVTVCPPPVADTTYETAGSAEVDAVHDAVSEPSLSDTESPAGAVGAAAVVSRTNAVEPGKETSTYRPLTVIDLAPR